MSTDSSKPALPMSTNAENAAATTIQRMAMTSSSLSKSSSALTSGKRNARSGCLHATVLSAYDLPLREPPLHVSVRVGNRVATTGPPVQRHKDRNSFRFNTLNPSSSSTQHQHRHGGPTRHQQHKQQQQHEGQEQSQSQSPHLNEIELYGPLPELYEDTVVIEIVYPGSVLSITPNGSAGIQTPNRTMLRATYPLHRLRINETAWLIVQLDDTAGCSRSIASRHSENNDNDNNNSSSNSDNDKDKDDNSTIEEYDDEIPPTLRLQLTLYGPYRSEIAALIRVGRAWFHFVDGCQARALQAWQTLPRVPIDPKWMIVPAVPVATWTIVCTPVLIGILILGLPIFVPLFVIWGIVGVCIACSLAITYCSTVHGRTQIMSFLGPTVHAILSTPSGQQMIYETGPRPSPVTTIKPFLPTDIWHRLILSFVIDFIGSASYLIPLAGEGFDMIWAPTQTLFIMALYNDTSPSLKYISMVEELLPFTDILPSATTGWIRQFGIPFIWDKLQNIHHNTPPGMSAQHQKIVPVQ